MWTCKVDWEPLVQEQEKYPGGPRLKEWMTAVKRKLGPRPSRWPMIECGSTLVPVRKGASMVVEIKPMYGKRLALAAERTPSELGDAIKQHHAKYYLAQTS